MFPVFIFHLPFFERLTQISSKMFFIRAIFGCVLSHFLRGSVGKPTSIRCADGRNLTCFEGTEGCMTNSTILCTKPLQWGENKTIYCGNVSVLCSAGTQGCYNNSQLYCQNMVGHMTTIHCADNMTHTCHTGTIGCYDNSTFYCS